MTSSSLRGVALLIVAVLVAVFYTQIKAFLVGMGLPLLVGAAATVAVFLACAVGGSVLLRRRGTRPHAS